MTYSIGDIVCSIAGRDIGQNYVVWEVDGNMLTLVNGKARKIVNPKIKNKTHVAFLKKSTTLIDALQNKQTINDAYLRKILDSEEKQRS